MFDLYIEAQKNFFEALWWLARNEPARATKNLKATMNVALIGIPTENVAIMADLLDWYIHSIYLRAIISTKQNDGQQSDMLYKWGKQAIKKYVFKKEYVCVSKIEAELRFQKARAFYSGYSDYRSAETLIREAIKLDRENPKYIYFLMLMLSAQKKDYRQWSILINKLKQIKNDDVDALPYIGGALSLLGDTTEAEKMLSRVIKLDPKNGNHFRDRGKLFYVQRKYKLAWNDFSNAIELNPNSAFNLQNRGMYFMLFKLYEEAIKDFSNAIELSPKDALTFSNRGSCFRLQGKFEKARDDYDRAIELAPNNPEYFFDRGLLFEGERRHIIAIENFSKAIELDPGNALYFSSRSHGFFKLKKFYESLEDLKKAKKFVNENDTVLTGWLDTFTPKLYAEITKFEKEKEFKRW